MPRPVRLAPSRQRAFVRRLLRWYAQHGRDLPWRHTRDPYRVLVSEIMLHQTQVPRVIPKYREFLRRYPSLEALARASPREVKEVWYPLGYNFRPLRLRAIARTVVRRYEGRLPDSQDELLKLKGIGRYTAGALLTFAHGRPAPILDTNVRRVLTRVFLGGRSRPDRDLWHLAAALLPARRSYDYNQGLMDFGATVCTPRAPRCPACPLREICRSYPSISRTATRS